MSMLKTLRGELVEAVSGVTTYDHVPARAVMPCAFVLAGSPYIAAAETFEARTVRFGLVLVTTPSLNEHETDALDELIEQTVKELEADGWTVEQVRQPQLEDLNGAETLTTTIDVATEATF